MFRVSTNPRYQEIQPGVFVPSVAVGDLVLSDEQPLPQRSALRLWLGRPIPTYVWRTSLWLTTMIVLGLLLGLFWVKVSGLKVVDVQPVASVPPEAKLTPVISPVSGDIPEARKASCEDSIAKALSSQSILFDSGSDRLAAASQNLLVGLVKPLQTVCPDTRIMVYGHTDDQGSPADNIHLSEQRAKAVAALFIAKGIKSERLVAEGYGSGRPIADNNTVEGRARNRRIEVKLNLLQGAEDVVTKP